ncbi:unnamed protein product [Nippostrongylus brasiliensis]|uniref:Phlebovirus_G2 domain-containing protein n=1 Tax=Nippostrongylus brasiliensis TaxID=27835 RepID=A0A0N4YUP6_NIPBR|nr:unnamed protein product [Nippostrongylus brasiliensis]
MEWKPLVNIRVRVSLYNKHTYKTLSLKPYVTHKIDNIAFTVISLSKPVSSLLTRKFAIANPVTLVIPEDYRIPVQCATHKEASEHFAKCKNTMICECDAEVSPARCNCPKESIEYITNDISNVLPVSTPFIKLISENGIVTALSRREEITVLVESNIVQDSAEYVVQQKCQITIGNIEGCYSCQEGATVNISCRAETSTWTIIQCEDDVISVECGPETITSAVVLDFNNAVVNQTCYSQCSGQSDALSLHGILAYLPHTEDKDILDSHQHAWIGTGSWFSEARLPDLQPLLLIAATHWKATIAVFGTIAVITISTYAFGPSLILGVIRVVFNLIPLLLRIAMWLLSIAVSIMRQIIPPLRHTVATSVGTTTTSN